MAKIYGILEYIKKIEYNKRLKVHFSDFHIKSISLITTELGLLYYAKIKYLN